MTKAEAREQLGSLIKDREALLDPEDPEGIYMADIEALQMAIGWLREGGGEMFTEGEMAGIIRAQDELLRYRELGTLEECREAVGRQRAKKQNRIDKCDYPSCGTHNERLTVPDEPIEGGIRRAVVDARAVRGEAMKIYWALKAYEDTGLTPGQVREMQEYKLAMGQGLAECREAAGGADGSHGALEGLKALFENRGRGW